MNLRLILSLILSCSAFQLLPICPEIEIWSDGFNYRYLMNDMHLDHSDGRISLKQQNDMVYILQKLQSVGKDPFLIVEDSLTESSTHSAKVKKEYQKRSRWLHQKITDFIAPSTLEKFIYRFYAGGQISSLTPIMFLANRCQNLGIKTYNAECRHSVGLLINGYNITKQDVVDDLVLQMKNVLKNPFIDSQFKKTILKRRLKELGSYHSEAQDVFIAKSILIGGALMEAQTICKLREWNQLKYGFIWQGGAHIANIKNALTVLGYKKIKNIGNATVWNLVLKVGENKNDFNALNEISHQINSALAIGAYAFDSLAAGLDFSNPTSLCGIDPSILDEYAIDIKKEFTVILPYI